MCWYLFQFHWIFNEIGHLNVGCIFFLLLEVCYLLQVNNRIQYLSNLTNFNTLIKTRKNFWLYLSNNYTNFVLIPFSVSLNLQWVWPPQCWLHILSLSNCRCKLFVSRQYLYPLEYLFWSDSSRWKKTKFILSYFLYFLINK